MISNPPTSAHRSLISLRSRRIRTLGVALLALVIGLCVYGYCFLMPSLHVPQSAARLAGLQQELRVAQSSTPASPVHQAEIQTRLDRTKKLLKTELLILYGFWAVCGTILLMLMLLAWMDLREVARVYAQERRAIWTDAIAKTAKDIPAEKRNAGE